MPTEEADRPSFWERLLGSGKPPSEHADVYAQLGYSLRCYQTLELTLRAALAARTGRILDESDLERVLNGSDKRTMGTLLEEIRRPGGAVAEVADGLADVVAARNRVVHRLCVDPGFDVALRNESGRAAVIAELTSMAREAEHSAKTLALGMALVEWMQSMSAKARSHRENMAAVSPWRE